MGFTAAEGDASDRALGTYAGGAGDTLSDDLLGASGSGGMHTAEISSQDTYIDSGDDVGMSTEPIDFTEDDGGDMPEEIEDMGVDRPSRRGAGGAAARPQRRAVALEEPKTNVFLILALGVAVVIGAWAALVNTSISRGHSNGITKPAAEQFGPKKIDG